MTVTLSGLPEMPIRDSPDNALIAYTVLMVVATGCFLLWWVRTPAERKIGPALPLIVGGGAISGLMEPWLDNVVLVGYPPHQALPVIEAFGRSVPIFVPIGYGWFCGGLLYLVARSFQRGITGRKVWAIYGIIALVDFVAIGLSSWIGILQFFGNPPMNILGYPLWWAGIDSLDVVLGGVLVFALLSHLRGISQLLYLVVPSIVLGASAGIVGWPVSTAINSQWSMSAKFLAAIASIGLSLTCVHFIGRALPGVARAVRAEDAAQVLVEDHR
jgi:hypothetical protein